jgi:hypothetical protein
MPLAGTLDSQSIQSDKVIDMKVRPDILTRSNLGTTAFAAWGG